jgi:hypothetical protein
LWEHKVLRRLNVRDDHRFLNKTNGDGQFFNTGHTEETKKLISEKLKGKIRSDAFKNHLSKINKGRLSSEKNGMFGKKHSDETKKKISDASKGKISKNNGKTYEEIQKDPKKALLRKQHHSKLMKDNNPFRGKSHSEDTKHNMSLKKKGKTWEEIYGIDGANKRREDFKLRKLNKIKGL